MEKIETRKPPFDMIPDKYRGRLLKRGCWFFVSIPAVNVLKGMGYRLTGEWGYHQHLGVMSLVKFIDFDAALFFMSSGLVVTLGIDGYTPEFICYDAGKGFAYCGEGKPGEDIIHVAREVDG